MARIAARAEATMMYVVAAVTALTVRRHLRLRVIRVVAGLAGKADVSATQLEAGCGMVELPEIPADRVMTVAAETAK